MGGWPSGLRRWLKLIFLQGYGVESRWEYDVFLCHFNKKNAVIKLQKLKLPECKSYMFGIDKNCNH